MRQRKLNEMYRGAEVFVAEQRSCEPVMETTILLAHYLPAWKN
jgi:hypothetical protein